MAIEPAAKRKVCLHYDDLPSGLEFGNELAIDTEALGLNIQRDRLCLLQISSGFGAHVIKFRNGNYAAPNLRELLADESKLKIFHFARFDLAAIYYYLEVLCKPIYCTKIASKIACTYKERHGLRELCRSLLGIDLNKQCQASNWACDKLSPEQLQYAAGDVLYLRELKTILDQMLADTDRGKIAQRMFDVLPPLVACEVAGWDLEYLLNH